MVGRMLRLADPTLVILVGPSASGKSTWAEQWFAAEQIVSSDRLRAMVGEGESDQAAGADAFAVLETVVEARVRRRLTTVVDTLGSDVQRRDGWLALARRHGVPCVAVAFDTPAKECRRRNAERARRVPDAALAAQLKAFLAQRPGLAEEGFDAVLAPDPVRVVPPAVAEAAASLPLAARPLAAQPQVAVDADLARPRRPRFGLLLSSFDVPGGPGALRDRLVDVAQAAEAAGFSSIWVMDHMRQIPQLGRAWQDMPESATILGYLAAATTSASIGSLVNCVTFRNVAHLGKAVATLDVLSGGRAWCGLGAGWLEAEHRAYGWRFPPAAERLDLLEDALQLLPLLWGKGTPSFDGRSVKVPEAMCYPRPLRGRVPLLVGGSGERRTLRLVAQYADACNLTGDVDTVRHKLGVLRRHCADVGRDPATIEVTHLSTALPALDTAELSDQVARRRPPRNVARWTQWATPGTVEDHVLRAGALLDAGVDHVIVSLVGVWDSPAIARYAEVIRALA